MLAIILLCSAELLSATAVKYLYRHTAFPVRYAT